MAVRRLQASTLLHAFLPTEQLLLRPAATLPFLRQLHSPSPLSIALPFPAAAIPSISSWLQDIWESVLRAVPKKKTSHMKKRHRQMAGKALKDVTALTRCPGCGMTKKAHTLCWHCVATIKDMWKGKKPMPKEAKA